MRIACTGCNAVYDLPPERVKPGRGVKCARCGTVWVPVELADVPPEIQAAPEPVVPPPVPAVTAAEPVAPIPPEPPPAEPVPEPPPAVVAPRRRPVLLGWLLTVLVLAGLGWAAVFYRGAVVQAWPPAERAYRLLHLG